MADPKLPRKPSVEAKKPEPGWQGIEGEAAASGKNRERENRLRIIDAFGRLGLSQSQWPDFVRAFYADPLQRIEYRQSMMPSQFQAPDFDRLNQSPEDWVVVADKAWEVHRNNFLQECEDWVTAGVDEPIAEVKRARGTGKERSGRVVGRRRGGNTPMDRRDEWAARYLVKVPLKEIAGADADATTVGRVAREILRLSGWATKVKIKPTKMPHGVRQAPVQEVVKRQPLLIPRQL
jgi:hypothetical protein